MGCGGFYLGPKVEGIEHLAHGGQHCAWYESTEEAVSLVGEYLVPTTEPPPGHVAHQLAHQRGIVLHVLDHLLAVDSVELPGPGRHRDEHRPGRRPRNRLSDGSG
jgi:hypothetical protein